MFVTELPWSKCTDSAQSTMEICIKEAGIETAMSQYDARQASEVRTFSEVSRPVLGAHTTSCTVGIGALFHE